MNQLSSPFLGGEREVRTQTPLGVACRNLPWRVQISENQKNQLKFEKIC